MTNVVEKVGEAVVKAGKVVAEDLGKVFGVADKIVKVLGTMVKDEAALKPALIAATEQAAAIAASMAKVEAEKGLNWTDDAALLSQVETYFKTTIEGVLVPAVEKVYGDLKVAVAEAA